MDPWYRKFWLRIVLRTVGALILGSAALDCQVLFTLSHGHPVADASFAEWLLAAMAFLGADAGLALLFVGGDLWMPVRVSRHWTRMQHVRDSHVN